MPGLSQAHLFFETRWMFCMSHCSLALHWHLQYLWRKEKWWNINEYYRLAVLARFQWWTASIGSRAGPMQTCLDPSTMPLLVSAYISAHITRFPRFNVQNTWLDVRAHIFVTEDQTQATVPGPIHCWGLPLLITRTPWVAQCLCLFKTSGMKIKDMNQASLLLRVTKMGWVCHPRGVPLLHTSLILSMKCVDIVCIGLFERHTVPMWPPNSCISC